MRMKGSKVERRRVIYLLTAVLLGGLSISSVGAEGISDANMQWMDETVYGSNYGISGNMVLGPYGGNKDKIVAIFKQTGLTWGDDYENDNNQVYSAVYVDEPIGFENTKMILRPSGVQMEDLYNARNNSLELKKGALLIVNGNSIDFSGDGYTLAAINVLNYADIQDAKLFVLNAKIHHVYKILDWEESTSDDTVEFGDMFTNNKFLKLTPTHVSDEVFAVKAVVDDTQIALLQNSALKNIASGLNDSEGPAADFLLSLGENPDDAAIQNAVNSLANFSELAGSTHGTYTTALLTSDLAQDHLSIAHHTKVMKKDLWAVYSHSNESVDGLSLTKQKADYEGSYNSYVIGSDLYEKDNLVLGVAGSYSTGKISSRHNAVSTKNEAKYYGASLYGRKINGKTSYLADLSYLHGSNDITQRNTGEVITGKPKTNAISLGVKAEQEFETAHGSFIPYAGVRYMHLSQGDYKNSAGFSYEQDDQNLFLIPLGVKFTTERQVHEWNVKPMAEVGLVINTGDKDTKATISDGTNVDALDYTIVNGTSLVGKLGVQAEKENITLGVSYRYQKSKDTSDNRLQLNLGYKF